MTQNNIANTKTIAATTAAMMIPTTPPITAVDPEIPGGVGVSPIIEVFDTLVDEARNVDFT